MHDDVADLPLLLPHVFPRFAAVGGDVDAIARRDVAADVRLAGTNVDNIGIRRRDCDGADGARRLIVEDRLPRDAAVGRLPDTARRRADVIDRRIARHAARSAHAAAGGGTDRAILQALERVLRLVLFLVLLRTRRHGDAN